MRVRLIIPLTLVAMAALHQPSPARADGCFISKKNIDVQQTSQNAIIFHENARENLILQVRCQTSVQEFGWLIPLPAKPTVETASMETFLEFDKLALQLNSVQAKAPPEFRNAGKYDFTIIPPDQPTLLPKWLKENQFACPAKKQDALQKYIAKKGYVVAIKIRLDAPPDPQTLVELAPVKISFASELCVFPLEMCCPSRAPIDTTVWTIAPEHRLSGKMDFFTAMNPGHLHSHNFKKSSQDLPPLKAGRWFVACHTRRFYPDMLDEELHFDPYQENRWATPKTAYFNDYFGKHRGHFFDELACCRKEVEDHKATGKWSPGAVRAPWELERIRRTLYLAWIYAPDLYADLAGDLLTRQEFGLLESLLANAPNKSIDAVAVRIAKLILKGDPVGSPRDAHRPEYLQLLRVLEKRGHAGVVALTDVLVDTRKNILARFPVSPESLAALVKGTDLQEKVATHLIGFLDAQAEPSDRYYAADYFWIQPDKRSIEPMIALLPHLEKDRNTFDRLMHAFAKHKDPRIAAAVLPFKDTFPGVVSSPLATVDYDQAHKIVIEWMTQPNRHGLALSFLAYQSQPASAAQRKAAIESLARTADKAVPSADPVMLARAIQANCRPGDPFLPQAIDTLKFLERTAKSDTALLHQTLTTVQALNSK